MKSKWNFSGNLQELNEKTYQTVTDSYRNDLNIHLYKQIGNGVQKNVIIRNINKKFLTIMEKILPGVFYQNLQNFEEFNKYRKQTTPFWTLQNIKIPIIKLKNDSFQQDEIISNKTKNPEPSVIIFNKVFNKKGGFFHKDYITKKKKRRISQQFYKNVKKYFEHFS